MEQMVGTNNPSIPERVRGIKGYQNINHKLVTGMVGQHGEYSR